MRSLFVNRALFVGGLLLLAATACKKDKDNEGTPTAGASGADNGGDTGTGGRRTGGTGGNGQAGDGVGGNGQAGNGQGGDGVGGSAGDGVGGSAGDGVGGSAGDGVGGGAGSGTGGSAGGPGDTCVDQGYAMCDEWSACWESADEDGIQDFHFAHGTVELCKQHVDIYCAQQAASGGHRLIVQDEENCYGSASGLTGCDLYRAGELLAAVVRHRADDPDLNPACEPEPSTEPGGYFGDDTCVWDSDCPLDENGGPQYCFEGGDECNHGTCWSRIPDHSSATNTDNILTSDYTLIQDGASTTVGLDQCVWGTSWVTAFVTGVADVGENDEYPPNRIAETDTDGSYYAWCQEVTYGGDGDDCALSPAGAALYGTDLQCDYGFYCSGDYKCEPNPVLTTTYLTNGETCERDGESLGTCVTGLTCMPATQAEGVTVAKRFCMPGVFVADVGDFCGSEPANIELEGGDYSVDLSVQCHLHAYCSDPDGADGTCIAKGSVGDNCQRDEQCWEGLECDATECAYPTPVTCE